MLVLTRKQGQSFLIGDQIEITVLETVGDKVRIAVSAPRSVSVLRKELVEAEQANKESAQAAVPDRSGLSNLRSVLKKPGQTQKPKADQEQ